MIEIQTYSTAITALGTLAGLMIVQLLIADMLGIMNKHTPGSTVTADHSNALFRAVRAVANTNESIAIFVCLFLFCVLAGADPDLTAYAAWSYVITRSLYALCYYTNQQTLRSVSFGLSIVCLLALLVVGVFY